MYLGHIFFNLTLSYATTLTNLLTYLQAKISSLCLLCHRLHVSRSFPKEPVSAGSSSVLYFHLFQDITSMD